MVSFGAIRGWDGGLCIRYDSLGRMQQQNEGHGSQILLSHLAGGIGLVPNPESLTRATRSMTRLIERTGLIKYLFKLYFLTIKGELKSALLMIMSADSSGCSSL